MTGYTEKLLHKVLDELQDVRVLCENKLMTQKDCALYMGVSLRHFRAKHAANIPSVKVGEKGIRYRKVELIKYLSNDNRG